ncbi:metal-dependent hydrolase [Aquirhabdus parva]|uniref:Metal-dependent hydrolase n=2 Tax=Aquirhabdus parva TaxID=2283318 RepID=A0A345PBQ6_9GAMM|nr:metal-dependent hydrolase [Aquirhabdus parva]
MNQAASTDISNTATTAKVTLTPRSLAKSKTITIRKTRFQAANLTEQYSKSPLISHFLTALSMSFPRGEMFFVDTIKNVRSEIKDPSLKADIAAFIGQESMHAKAHDQFNTEIQSADYHLKRFDAEIDKEMARLRTLSKRRQLAATVALEHFTAMIAGYILTHPKLVQQLPPNMASLWIWHAVEEIEHKHVAFDVYQTVFNNLAQRRRSMRTISLGFIISNTVMTSQLLWQNRKQSLGSVKQIWANLQGVGTLAHMMVSLLPEYLAFYKESFHPSEIDHTPLLARWREELVKKEWVEV